MDRGGATQRPRETRWSPGVAAVFWVRFSATPGSEQTHPRQGASPRSPLAELGTAPDHSPARHRAAVWVGRGATVRTQEAEISRVAGGLGVLQPKRFSKVRLDITFTVEVHIMIGISCWESVVRRYTNFKFGSCYNKPP